VQASADVVGGDFGLEVIDTAWSDMYVRVLLSGGTPAVTSTVNVLIVDSNGTQQSWQIGIYTEDLAAVQYPQSGPYLTLNGIPLSIGQLLIPDGTQIGAGTPVISSVEDASLIVSASGDGGGVRPYTYTFYRAPDNYGAPGTFVTIGTPSQTSYITDTAVIPGNSYWYKYSFTDSSTSPNSATSATVSFTVPIPVQMLSCDCVPSQN
jgi:hypothetical protein